MSNQAIHYSSKDPIAARFFNLAAIAAFKKNGYDYKKNMGEKLADTMLYPKEILPSKLSKFMKDPRVVTLEIASLAILGVSFAFYPSEAPEVLHKACSLIPIPPAWAVKFSAYILSIETILGYTVRAESRFCNTDLTDQLDSYNQ